MLKNKLTIFLAKKAVFFLIILSILDIVVVKHRWITLAGLLLGGVFSLLKFNSMAELLGSLTLKTAIPVSGAKVAIKYGINTIALIALLFAALKIHLWLFLGLTAGVLMVPFIIVANGITEGLGITHNGFE